MQLYYIKKIVLSLKKNASKSFSQKEISASKTGGVLVMYLRHLLNLTRVKGGLDWLVGRLYPFVT